MICIVRMILVTTTTQPVLMMVSMNVRNSSPVFQDLVHAMVDSVKKTITGIGSSHFMLIIFDCG